MMVSTDQVELVQLVQSLHGRVNNSVLLQASGIDNSVTKQEKPAAKRRAQDVESDVSRTDDESISSKEEEERINKGLKVTEDFRKTSSRNPFETKDTKPKKKRKNDENAQLPSTPKSRSSPVVDNPYHVFMQQNSSQKKKKLGDDFPADSVVKSTRSLFGTLGRNYKC